MAGAPDLTRVRLGTVRAVGLRFVCSRCSHVRLIKLGEALQLWGERTTLGAILNDIFCSKCRRKALRVTLENDWRKYPSEEHAQPWGRGREGPIEKALRAIAQIATSGKVE